MILTKTEMASAPGKTFMLTISLVSTNELIKMTARPQHSALTPVRCAECGLFA
jgi:hypothetical protein